MNNPRQRHASGIPAKYPQHCTVCGGDIRPGDLIIPSRGRLGAGHVACMERE